MTIGHEAHSLPCHNCGAPLPVNPLSPWAYCPRCQRATAVPDELRRSALAYQQAVQDAWKLRRAREQGAEAALADAHVKAQGAKAYDTVIMFYLVIEVVPLLGMAFAAVVFGVPALLAGQPAGVVVGVCMVVAGLALVLIALVLRLTAGRLRSRRSERRRDVARTGMPAITAAAFRNAGASTIAGAESASCSVCGGPIGFQVGVQRIQCRHCSAVVMPCTGQKRGLVSLAMREAEAALWQKARAERTRRRADQRLARERALMMAMIMGGSFLCVAPLIALAWGALLLVRRIKFGVDDLLDEFAAGIDAPLERTRDAPFEWLDAYWIDDDPLTLKTPDGLLGVRWSTWFWYAGRPVLLTVLSDWSDGTAESVTLLVAHPADRPGQPPGWSPEGPAAEHARALGYTAAISRAGVALTAARLPAGQLTAANLHALVASAHGLAAVG